MSLPEIWYAHFIIDRRFGNRQATSINWTAGYWQQHFVNCRRQCNAMQQQQPVCNMLHKPTPWIECIRIHKHGLESLSSNEETFDYKDIWKFWLKISMYKFSNFLIKCSFLRHFYGQYFEPLKSHRRQTTSTTIPIDFGFLLYWSFRLTNTVNMTMIFGCAPAIWPIIALHRMIWPGLFTTFAMIPNGRIGRRRKVA